VEKPKSFLVELGRADPHGPRLLFHPRPTAAEPFSREAVEAAVRRAVQQTLATGQVKGHVRPARVVVRAPPPQRDRIVWWEGHPDKNAKGFTL